MRPSLFTFSRRGHQSVPLTPHAPFFAYQFHDSEIIPVDSALTVEKGNYHCPDLPLKSDPPRKWDVWCQ